MINLIVSGTFFAMGYLMAYAKHTGDTFPAMAIYFLLVFIVFIAIVRYEL